MPVIRKYSLKGREYINWVFINIGSKKSWGRWTIVKLHSQKKISESQIGIEPAIFWRPVRRSNSWATKTQMASYGATDIYAQPKRKPLYVDNDRCSFSVHRWSKGCGFDPRPGLRNRFSEYKAWRSFIYLKIYTSSHISKIRNCI